jgi:hypothetical protein
MAKASGTPRSSASSATRTPSPRLVGTILLAQNEWPLQGARNIMLESIVPVSDGLPIAAG